MSALTVSSDSDEPAAGINDDDISVSLKNPNEKPNKSSGCRARHHAIVLCADTRFRGDVNPNLPTWERRLVYLGLRLNAQVLLSTVARLTQRYPLYAPRLRSSLSCSQMTEQEHIEQVINRREGASVQQAVALITEYDAQARRERLALNDDTPSISPDRRWDKDLFQSYTPSDEDYSQWVCFLNGWALGVLVRICHALAFNCTVMVHPFLCRSPTTPSP